MSILSIHDLKRTGLAKLRQMFHDEPDIVIQERGKDACVLVELAYYDHLKACELEVALIEARQDITAKRYRVGVAQHIKHMERVLGKPGETKKCTK